MSDPAADLLELSIAELHAGFRSRALSPVDLVSACVDRITATDEVIGAWVFVAADAALEQAREAESAFARGEDRGPLHGIPLGVKDLVDISGEPTEANSPLRVGRVAEVDAEVIRRLREAGAVFLGKTRTDQFAYGASTPGTVNPWAPDSVPGGSSGGSGAAVAARQVTLAIGTDTAGSIRIPSSLCGVVGLKPTHGRVPRHGVVPLAWSFDNVGPIGRSVGDVAAMFDVMSGEVLGSAWDLAGDGGSAAAQAADLSAVRIGVPTNHFFDDVDPEVEASVRQVIARLEARGATTVEVAVPHDDLFEAVLYAMLLPEAAAYHAQDFPARADGFSTQLRKALTIGSSIPAVDYVQAQRMRWVVAEDWRAMFEACDFVVAPTTPMPAVPTSQKFVAWPSGMSESVNSAYVRLCLAGNLTGFPAVSLPCGLSSAGLPMGVQLLAGPNQDLRLLEVAAVLEADLEPIGAPPAG
ncbi:MAG: amidase [Nocardioidaceae bacterium]